ncbi:MAG: HEAT repeat domain-containing protein [Planctomycetota bacterium]
MRIRTAVGGLGALFAASLLASLMAGCASPATQATTGAPSSDQSSTATGPAGFDAANARGLVSEQTAREQALSVLLGFAESPDPQIRANAIEALSMVPRRAESAIRRGLVDQNEGVRAVSALAAGRAGLPELAAFLRPLSRDRASTVRVSAIAGLVLIGEPVDRTPIATVLLTDPAPRARAQAAFVLGELGDASAVQLLRQAAMTDIPRGEPGAVRSMRLQVAEALVKLGDEDAVQEIRAALYPSRPEELEFAALAAQILGNVKDEASAGQLITLTAFRSGGRLMPAEVRLAAAGSLALLGREEGWFIADGYAADASAVIRSQAAHVYGRTRGGDNLAKLAIMLEDSSPLVRVAAASGMLEQTTAGRS